MKRLIGIINNPIVKSLFSQTLDNYFPAPPSDRKFIVTHLHQFIITNDGKRIVTSS